MPCARKHRGVAAGDQIIWIRVRIRAAMRVDED
jgi:hypothetical protein